VAALYGDRTTLLQRESLGLVCDEGNTLYATKQITEFYNRLPIQVPIGQLEEIFCFCDPCGGGTSELACVSIAEYGGHTLVSVCVVLTGVQV
jgi:hypothetical protein